MRTRVGLRARTDFDVVAKEGGILAHCRAVDLSVSGILIDRGRLVRSSDERLVVDLALRLPERTDVLFTRGRLVWSRGTQQAFRFVAMTDADRLTIAEHVDLQRHRGSIAA